MKSKKVLFLFLMLVFSVSLVSAFSFSDFLHNLFGQKSVTGNVASPLACGDTDNGRNYFLKGTTTGKYDFEDEAASAVSDACSAQYSGYLEEHSCYNNLIFDENYLCPNGCSDGKCIQVSQPPPENLFCNDTDGGRNYSAKGTTTGKYDAEDAQFSIVSDSCSAQYSGYLEEHSCYNNLIFDENYQCPNGCSNGVCLQSNQTLTCTDSDGGLDYYVKGNITGINERDIFYFYADYCSPAPYSNNLQEVSCKNGGVGTETSYSCPNGCSNGACVGQSTSCPSISVMGSNYSLNPCVVNINMTDGLGDVYFNTTIHQFGASSAYGFAYYITALWDAGFPFGSVNLLTRARDLPGDQVLRFSLNDSILQATTANPNIYSGNLPILINGISNAQLNLSINLNLYGASTCNSLFNFGSNLVNKRSIISDAQFKSGIAVVDLLFGNGTSFVDFGFVNPSTNGVDRYHKFVASSLQPPVFYLNESENSYFVVSWKNGAETESYLLGIDNIIDDHGENTTQLIDLAGGKFYLLQGVGGQEDVGSHITLTLVAANDRDKVAVVKATPINGVGNVYGTRVIYDKNGNYINLTATFPASEVPINVFDKNNKLIQKYLAYWEGGQAKVRLVENNCAPPQPQVCQQLIDKVKNPTDFIDDRLAYVLSGNNTNRGSWFISGKEERFNQYSTGWEVQNGANYNYINYELNVFDNKDINLDSAISDLTYSDLCVTKRYGMNNVENTFYVCSYDPIGSLSDGNLNSDPQLSKHNTVIWVDKNVVVRVYLVMDSGRQLTDAEINAIRHSEVKGFIDDLRDNRFNHVSGSYFDIDYPLGGQIQKSLMLCPSEIKPEANPAQWECKMEPVVCPEHGTQTRICRDANGNNPSKETEVQCSPGICSGCYVPRWLGYDNDNNVCVPYGIRLAQTKEGRENVPEGVDLDVNGRVEYNLTIYSSQRAHFYYQDKAGGEIFDTDIIEFGQYDLVIDGSIIRFRVEKINPRVGENRGFVELSIITNFNAFCNYNGHIQEQEGDDARCQNNYECSSNECRSGFCVNTYVEVAKQTSFLARIWCKLTNLPILGGTDAGYEQCLQRNSGG